MTRAILAFVIIAADISFWLWVGAIINRKDRPI